MSPMVSSGALNTMPTTSPSPLLSRRFDSSELKRRSSQIISPPPADSKIPLPNAAPLRNSTERQFDFEDLSYICHQLELCMQLRRTYMDWSCQNPDEHEGSREDHVDLPISGPYTSCVYEMKEGVFEVLDSDDISKTSPRFPYPSLKTYFNDLNSILAVISDGPVKSFAFRRLRILESKFSLYQLENEFVEVSRQKLVPHRDFYNVRKIDNHVHHSSSMNQKHLLRFIKSKLKKCPNDIVIFRDNKYLTLAQVFESLHLTAYDLSVDTLDMHAHKDSFHRFDKFNLKYNPIGESRLREIFLKTDNLIGGTYLAEITKELIADLEASKYQFAEYRISIYGKSYDEWWKMASWIHRHQLYSENVRWIIQIPRLYNIYREQNLLENFEEFLHNIFAPLFEVTQNPLAHPELHRFLHHVVGFDSVDDESKTERRIHSKYPPPAAWTSTANPPYSYYLYYMYANLAQLNQFRQQRNFSKFHSHQMTYHKERSSSTIPIFPFVDFDRDTFMVCGHARD
jgi:AMP deaminase